MILRRMVLFIALLFGVGATQLPEYVQQYRQALGGAIGELDAIVAAFDSRTSQHGLSEAAGIDRLLKNADPIAHGEGEQMQENVKRLENLRATQTQLRADAPVARVFTVATHYDQRVARSAWNEFEPAVPTSIEALVFGVIGALFGGGAVHIAGRPFRRRRQERLPGAQPAT